MAHTLKLRGAEPVLPGLALPEAFESLDKRLEATVQLCQLKGCVEGQMLGVLAVCQELQRLLKFAFIENGMLASRIEILTRHQTETLKKMEKKQLDIEIDHKVTKKQIKTLRKRISKHETIERRSREQWWDIKVKTSDYDSFTYLARGSGAPDLDFMLRVNQILIDFVKDEDRTELMLPPMGNEERTELSKLASIYKLRCRFGKSTQLAASTLIKARQTCIPGPGEVDTILDTFARLHKHVETTDSATENKQESTSTTQDTQPQDGQTSPQSRSVIPPSMLTPFSHLTSPTIDIGLPPSSATPVQSPPNSGLSTPTAESAQKLRKSSSSNMSDATSSTAATAQDHKPKSHGAAVPVSRSENPLLGSMPILKSGVKPPVGVTQPPAIKSPTRASSVSPQVQRFPAQSGQFPIFVAGAATPVSSGTGSSSPTQKGTTASGSILIQHHGQVRALGHPTVVASPLKVPLTQLPQMVQSNLGGSGGGGGSGGSSTGEVLGKREKVSPASAAVGGSTPAKRVRVTRQSASGNTAANED